jgi:hypothetical protein
MYLHICCSDGWPLLARPSSRATVIDNADESVDEADHTDEGVDEVEDATDGCRVPVGRLAPELPARQDLRPAGQSDRCPLLFILQRTRHLPVLHVLDFDCM